MGGGDIPPLGLDSQYPLPLRAQHGFFRGKGLVDQVLGVTKYKSRPFFLEKCVRRGDVNQCIHLASRCRGPVEKCPGHLDLQVLVPVQDICLAPGIADIASHALGKKFRHQEPVGCHRGAGP